jgi:hypothetical protein
MVVAEAPLADIPYEVKHIARKSSLAALIVSSIVGIASSAKKEV